MLKPITHKPIEIKEPVLPELPPVEEVEEKEEPVTPDLKIRMQCVREIPAQEVRVLENKETNEKTFLFTIEEALTILMNREK